MEYATAPKPDRTVELLKNIRESLLDLFDTNETFFITNDSMRVLLSGLSEQLNEAVEDKEEDALFERWNRNMPTTKKNLLKIANDKPLYLADGRWMPIMNEGKSSQLLKNCLPDSPKF